MLTVKMFPTQLNLSDSQQGLLCSRTQNVSCAKILQGPMYQCETEGLLTLYFFSVKLVEDSSTHTGLFQIKSRISQGYILII